MVFDGCSLLQLLRANGLDEAQRLNVPEVRSPISRLIRSAGCVENMFFLSVPRVFFPRPRTSPWVWRIPAMLVLGRRTQCDTHSSTDHTFPARMSLGAISISISAQLSISAIRCVTAIPFSCSEHARESDMTGVHQRLSSSITAIKSRLRISPRDWRSRGCAWVRRPPLARSAEGLHMPTRTPKLYSLPTHALV